MRNQFSLSWTSVAFLAALCLFGGMARAEEPVLKFRIEHIRPAATGTEALASATAPGTPASAGSRPAAAATETLAKELHPSGSGPPESTVTLAFTQGVWLVATAPAFRAPLAPLIEHRRAEGFKVLVVETTNVLSPEEIWLSQGAALETCIRRLLEPGKGPNYVLLAGTAGTPDAAAAQQIVVPALPGRNGVMKQRPSDYAYGLPRRDQDGECAAAVGRFPACTVEEMQGMVEKTLSMEQNCRRPGAWRNRLALIQGNPEAGFLGEMFVGQLMAQRLGRLHPA